MVSPVVSCGGGGDDGTLGAPCQFWKLPHFLTRAFGGIVLKNFSLHRLFVVC